MSGKQAQPITFAGIRGRDGSKSVAGLPPEFGGIPMHRCREAVNVDFYRVGLARKRPGTEAVSLTFISGGPFASEVRSLCPSSLLVIWAVDGSGQIAFKTAGLNWVEVVVTDAVSSAIGAVVVPFRGNHYFVYANGAGRLHVWDSVGFRRTGMGTPVAPTVANTGSGSYGAIARYYRARMGVLSGSTVLRQGEAGASQSFTPSGSGTAARVTKPTTIEDATHWRVEVSLDDAVWYLLSPWTAVGTTTYDDTTVTTAYSSNDAAPLAGEFTNWVDVSFLLAAEGRLLGMTTAGRIYFSSVIGTTSASYLDQERVPDTVAQKNYIDLEEDAIAGTGLAGPFLGSYWAFQQYSIHRLQPTSVPESPFIRKRMFANMRVGCIRQQSIVQAVDEFGRPALYWMSSTGPYRMTSDGLQFMGDDISDIWDAVVAADAVDLMAGVTGSCFGVYYAHLHQIWWWITTQASGIPNYIIVFDTRLGRADGGSVRDGWSYFTGAIVSAWCACMAEAGGAIDVPVIGLRGSTAIVKANPASALVDDAGTQYQGYVDIPERAYGGMTHKCGLNGAEVVAAGSGTTALRLTATGLEARTFEVTIGSSETRGRFEDAEMESSDALSFRLGDAAASAETWAIEALTVAVERREARFP